VIAVASITGLASLKETEGDLDGAKHLLMRAEGEWITLIVASDLLRALRLSWRAARNPPHS
jgi:hypothetical protein